MLKRKFLSIVALLPVVILSVVTNTHAAENPEPSFMYDESVYTKETEKAMDKMHKLFIKAFDKNSSLGEREKAKRKYVETGRDLIKRMHERVMALDVKKGAALSHTDVLLSVHMMAMMLDMLAAIQQEEWVDPTML